MDRQNMALFVIRTGGQVHGRTRLAKILQAVDYAGFKGTGKRAFKAGSFGAFDGDIAAATRSLEGRGLIQIKEGARYSYLITREGRRTDINPGWNEADGQKIVELIDAMNSRPHDEVLAAMYEAFPELAGKSATRAGVNRAVTGSSSAPPPGYELFGEEDFLQSVTDGARRHAPRLKHNDLGPRMEMMRMFGWDRLPEQTNPDPGEGSGLLNGYPKLEKIKK